MTTLFRAAWVLPIVQPPRRDGWVLAEDGRIAASGAGEAPPADREVHLGHVAVLPGLVNAHTHIELSWLKARVPPALRMPDWIRTLMTLRREEHRDDPFAMAAAIGELRRFGTAVVGDITNTLASVHALGASPLSAHVFYEVLGFDAPDPAGKVHDAAGMARAASRSRLRASVVPHAPYSVSPVLFREVAALAARERWTISIHLGESPEEVQFLRTGEGPWRDLIQALGVWNPSWKPPGTGPVAYLDSFGLLGDKTLVVHAVQLDDAELRRVADRGATIVTCPRSNEWVGVGPPPVSRFFASGARVAVGTDSLASCPDLNLFSELRRMRLLAPDVPPSRLLHSATRAGAEALGFADDHGSIENARRADLVAVDVPEGTTDVEEYLCGGIRAEQVRWVSDEPGRRS
jgi:cytosine/adenosine deaminase-related metal-dependent hydrolase